MGPEPSGYVLAWEERRGGTNKGRFPATREGNASCQNIQRNPIRKRKVVVWVRRRARLRRQIPPLPRRERKGRLSMGHLPWTGERDEGPLGPLRASGEGGERG